MHSAVLVLGVRVPTVSAATSTLTDWSINLNGTTCSPPSLLSNFDDRAFDDITGLDDRRRRAAPRPICTAGVSLPEHHRSDKPYDDEDGCQVGAVPAGLARGIHGPGCAVGGLVASPVGRALPYDVCNEVAINGPPRARKWEGWYVASGHVE